MKKKGIAVLFIIFCFMLLLNIMTPLLYEDYGAVLAWPDNTRRISNITDVFRSVYHYYLTGGGRIIGSFTSTFITWQGKYLFNPINALMMVLLVAEIYWLSHKGNVTTDFDHEKLFWIFFALWSFNGPFIDTCLWMSGSTDYLWMLVVVLAFLIPYIREFYHSRNNVQQSEINTTGMFFLGILAGCSHETTICWLILVLFYWLYLCKKQDNLPSWKIAGFAGLCLGYCLLIVAPGNYARLAATQHYISHDSRMRVDFLIIFFQLFLWYYIFKVFFAFKNDKLSHNIQKHFNLSKACLLIAGGSTLFNVLLPVSGWRPSFLSLVFLILAVFILYFAQNETGKSVIIPGAKRFLKFVACSYFILSVLCCLYGDYNNWQHWERMIKHIQSERRIHPGNVVEVTLPSAKPFEKTFLWSFLTMFRVIYQPIGSEDETHYLNKEVAKYYDIKGIKVVNNIKTGP